MGTFRSNAFAALSLLLLNACASQQAKAPDKGKGDGVATTTTQVSCTQVAANAIPNPNQWIGAKVDGNNLKLLGVDGLSVISACDALNSQGKKAAIFQFTATDCIACYDEAKRIQAQIASLGDNSVNFTHFVVFVEKAEDRSAAEVQTFMANNTASKGIALYDNVNDSLWKKVAKSTIAPSFGAAFIINNLGHYAEITKGDELQTLLNQMNQIVSTAN